VDETSAAVRITGVVQGVGYRAWTQQTARHLGVRGWVRNEPDRSVAGVFVGPRDAVESLVERCEQGPPFARVSEVQSSYEAPRDDESFDDFVIAT